MPTLAEYLAVPYSQRSTAKPRTQGITMIMDQGWPADFARGMLDAFGDYVDIVKLWDPHLRQSVDEVRAKIQVYRDHDVIVQPGGLIVEAARQAGESEGYELLPRLKELGFDSVEVSSTTSTRTDIEAEVRFVRHAKDMGFVIFGEVGRKFWDGDETRLTHDTLDVGATVHEFEALLGAGARQVYWEGHLLRAVMGDDPETIKERASTGTQQVLEVVERVGLERIIFETSGLRPIPNRQWLQFWLIRLFGPEVNIANARIEEMGNLEALRSGSHPIFGFGSAGNYPFLRAQSQGRPDWWRA